MMPVAAAPSPTSAIESQYAPHPLIRLANRVARPLSGWVALNPVELLDRAVQRTGLSDFGDDAYRVPLEVLLRAYDEESRLTFAGRMTARLNTLRLLEQRLWFEEYRKRHPDIVGQVVERPLFIVSLSRGGTTLLHRLLAQDPANRTPLSWELMQPIPPPERDSYDTDARIAKAERELRMFERLLAPNLRAVHELGARLPEECLMIMAPSFRSFQFPSMHYVPSYQHWMEHNDLTPGYAYHRRVLQHLQSRHSGDRWVLKAPAHIFGIAPIFATYPDAGIIHLHRDPLEVAASLTSLTVAIYAAFSDGIDPSVVGRDLVETLHSGLQCYVRDRAAVDQPKRFLDLRYREFLADPIATVQQVYDFFAIPFSAEAETRMRRYMRDNPQAKHGIHRYSLAQFGIDRDVENERFRPYRERFGV